MPVRGHPIVLLRESINGMATTILCALCANRSVSISGVQCIWEVPELFGNARIKKGDIV